MITLSELLVQNRAICRERFQADIPTTTFHELAHGFTMRNTADLKAVLTTWKDILQRGSVPSELQLLVKAASLPPGEASDRLLIRLATGDPDLNYPVTTRIPYTAVLIAALEVTGYALDLRPQSEGYLAMFVDLTDHGPLHYLHVAAPTSALAIARAAYYTYLTHPIFSPQIERNSP